mgnify:CR=1 FL=1
MTLIVSHLDRNGIVMASDSNLTAGNQLVGTSPKVFAVPNLDAGVGIAGSWSIAGGPMDDWINRFIGRSRKGDSLDDFVESLRQNLEWLMTDEEKGIGTLIHVAGYVPDSKLGFHPVHWIVSNVEGLDDDGDYILPPKKPSIRVKIFGGRIAKSNTAPAAFTKKTTKGGRHTRTVSRRVGLPTCTLGVEYKSSSISCGPTRENPDGTSACSGKPFLLRHSANAPQISASGL